MRSQPVIKCGGGRGRTKAWAHFCIVTITDWFCFVLFTATDLSTFYECEQSCWFIFLVFFCLVKINVATGNFLQLKNTNAVWECDSLISVAILLVEILSNLLTCLMYIKWIIYWVDPYRMLVLSLRDIQRRIWNKCEARIKWSVLTCD